MESLDVQVLGGTFTVLEIISQENQTEDQIRDILQSVPPDRWFVMLDEEIAGDQKDTLALIDDNFEFLILAAGKFEGD